MTQEQRAQALNMSSRMLRRYERLGCPAELGAAREWLEANVVRRHRGANLSGFHAAGFADLVRSGLFFFFALHCHRSGIPEAQCAQSIDTLTATAALLIDEGTGGRLDLGADFERWRLAPYTVPAAPGKVPIASLEVT
jgi:hypothetical protein